MADNFKQLSSAPKLNFIVNIGSIAHKQKKSEKWNDDHRKINYCLNKIKKKYQKEVSKIIENDLYYADDIFGKLDQINLLEVIICRGDK